MNFWISTVSYGPYDMVHIIRFVIKNESGIEKIKVKWPMNFREKLGIKFESNQFSTGHWHQFIPSKVAGFLSKRFFPSKKTKITSVWPIKIMIGRICPKLSNQIELDKYSLVHGTSQPFLFSTGEHSNILCVGFKPVYRFHQNRLRKKLEKLACDKWHVPWNRLYGSVKY